LLIALADQTRSILDLVPHHGGEPALKTWAAGVARDNRSHLTALRELLAATGVPHRLHEDRLRIVVDPVVHVIAHSVQQAPPNRLGAARLVQLAKVRRALKVA